MKKTNEFLQRVMTLLLTLQRVLTLLANNIAVLRKNQFTKSTMSNYDKLLRLFKTKNSMESSEKAANEKCTLIFYLLFFRNITRPVSENLFSHLS